MISIAAGLIARKPGTVGTLALCPELVSIPGAAMHFAPVYDLHYALFLMTLDTCASAVSSVAGDTPAVDPFRS